MARVAISLLGGFAATVEDAELGDSGWRLKKARELVKLLALAPGQRLHREQAMDVLWRDRDPASAANNLHQAVHVARRVLGGEAIETRDELLLLAAEVDVDRFERAAADARRAGSGAAYRAALSLYAGELLPENRYDDWVAGRREELAGLRAALLEELARLDADDGLRGLPAETSSFVGRGHELGELRVLLGRGRLLTLTGTGGVGKTRLALELARSEESSYASGAALVELGTVLEGALVPDAVAAALDLHALPGQAPLDSILDFLAPRTLLLVVDNCEHLLGATASLLEALLRAAPRLSIVATSREPLRIPGELIFRVPSLAIPDPEQRLAPAELVRYEAVRLFVERAEAAAPGFALDPENAGDVARICFRLDGLPLALELAAGRLGALGAASIADRLDDRFRILRAGSRSAPTRRQTLAATLQWSHDLLEPDEQVLLRRLAVFAGGFELVAAETVCVDDGRPAGEVADALARLVEKSLVVAEQGARERRYRLLETVRLYARARLEDAGEAGPYAERHARWALALAELERGSTGLDREAANLRSALDTMLAHAPEEALRLCVALWPFWLRRIELVEAQRRLSDGLAAAPSRSALRLHALLAAAAIDYRAGTLARGTAHVQEALGIADEIGDAHATWKATYTLGAFAVASDSAEEAIVWLERALALARRQDLVAEEALCVYSLGVARWILGDLAGAEELLERSIEMLCALAPGSDGLIPSPLNIAEMRTADASGRPGLRVVFEDTLQPFLEISCEAAIASVLASRAAIARLRGDLAHARELLDESAERSLRSGDERGQADVLVRRAYLELEEGSVAEARSCLERSLELRRRLNDRRGVGLVLSGLGLVETMSGDHEVAELRLAEARDLFRRAGDRWGLASSLWRVADLALARGRLNEAEAALEEARVVLGETNRLRWIAHTLDRLGEVALRRGETARAARLLEEARADYLAKGDAAGVAAVEIRIADLAKAGLRPRKALAATNAGTDASRRRKP
ncbi:MAG: ATP-binding protein [Gaiellaceae bacterium]